jgi:hypothetical protein
MDINFVAYIRRMVGIIETTATATNGHLGNLARKVKAKEIQNL